jgi:hypothetical protein
MTDQKLLNAGPGALQRDTSQEVPSNHHVIITKPNWTPLENLSLVESEAK